MKPIWAVGLMTGTVLDGNIDVALLRTDGETVAEFGTYRLAPYSDALRALLVKTLDAARVWGFEGPEPAIFAEAEDQLTRAQAAAVRELVETEGPGMDQIGVVGFHGQTVLHRAPETGRIGQTRQLGDGALMADILGVPVAYDFRSADMAAGGQGAPLSAIYHAALLRSQNISPDTAVLNLGGVGNVTWWDGGEQIVAFDTGPANAPINDFVAAKGLGDMDRDGALALAGKVDEARLTKLLTHPYLDRPYPKSLDRFDFTADMAAGCNAEDGAALLTAFTTTAVGRALDLLPKRPRQLIVCGGGRRNPAIMKMLPDRADVKITPAKTLGWRGDAIEAECFAFLAVRTMRALPISFPTTTGAPAPMTGGALARPNAQGATTETVAASYANIDEWSVPELVSGMITSQRAAINVVQSASAAIEHAITAAAERLSNGGRLIYLGAGTSGRIATQDAVELWPTFNWSPERALSFMAGGDTAFTQAREGAEDSEAEAVETLNAANVTADDAVVGVAASGNTPYTVAGLHHARAIGALTIGVYNNAGGKVGGAAEIPVLLNTGPEFLAGSTRLKAGTSQKVALNTFSTGVMIRLGLVYRGQMVAMRISNDKLRKRGILMISNLTDTSPEEAEQALDAAGGVIRTAVLMLARALDRGAAEALLDRAKGNLGDAMQLTQ